MVLRRIVAVERSKGKLKIVLRLMGVTIVATIVKPP